MWLVGVLYVTRNGQTAKIANHVAHRLTGLGVEAQLRNLDSSPDTPGLSTYDAVILAAPVHRGRHGRAMTGFVKRHLDALRNIPAAFISVSLSQAGVERAGTTPKAHAAFVADVQGVLDRFSQETGWYPEQVKPVAGALKYTEYNFLLRFMMKQIAKRAGAATDTSRDYEYTNWQELYGFVTRFAEQAGFAPPAHDTESMALRLQHSEHKEQTP